MREQFASFVQSPTLEGYLDLRQRIVQGGHYNPACDGEDQLWTLLHEKAYDEAQERIPQWMENFLLCPSYHKALSILAEARNEADRTEFESWLASSLLRCLLQTGNGTPERPYEVMRVGEELTILAALNLHPLRVQTLFVNGKVVDKMDTREGESVYFSVSLILNGYPR